jgi:alpha-mannosidase
MHKKATNLSSYPSLNYGPGEKWVKNLTRDRLNNFHGGHYSNLNLSSVLFKHRADSEEFVNLRVWATAQLEFYFNHLILYLSSWSAPGLSKPTFEEAMQQKFKPAKKVSFLFAFLVGYLKRSV